MVDMVTNIFCSFGLLITLNMILFQAINKKTAYSTEHCPTNIFVLIIFFGFLMLIFPKRIKLYRKDYFFKQRLIYLKYLDAEVNYTTRYSKPNSTNNSKEIMMIERYFKLKQLSK